MKITLAPTEIWAGKNSVCDGSLKFPLACNGKTGNCHLLRCYCRYLKKKFYKHVYGVVLFHKHAKFVQMTNFDWIFMDIRDA